MGIQVKSKGHCYKLLQTCCTEALNPLVTRCLFGMDLKSHG
jgi:hypothetical protein